MNEYDRTTTLACVELSTCGQYATASMLKNKNKEEQIADLENALDHGQNALELLNKRLLELKGN